MYQHIHREKHICTQMNTHIYTHIQIYIYLKHTYIYKYKNIHIQKYIHIHAYNIHAKHTKHDKTEHAWKHTCIYTYIKPLRPDPTK